MMKRNAVLDISVALGKLLTQHHYLYNDRRAKSGRQSVSVAIMESAETASREKRRTLGAKCGATADSEKPQA